MTIPFWFEGFDGYPLITSTAARDYFINQRGLPALQATTGDGGFYNDTALGTFYRSGTFALRFDPPNAGLHNDFVYGGALFAESDALSRVLSIVDVNAVVLSLNISFGSWELTYNPADTANDIAASGSAPLAVNFYEIVWSGSTLKLFINNSEVYSKSWTGVTARPQTVGPTNTGHRIRAYNVYYGPTRLGMHRVRILPLEAPTVDTGAETGAASPQLALSSFDQDTSYYTLVNGTAQAVLMPVGDLPSEVEVVHGVKLSVQSRKTDAGAVTGSIQVKTASESTVATTIDAVGYATGHTVLTNDPHTAAPFTGAAINSMQVGVKEGV